MPCCVHRRCARVRAGLRDAWVGGEKGIELVKKRKRNFGNGEAGFGRKVFGVVNEVLEIVISFDCG